MALRVQTGASSTNGNNVSTPPIFNFFGTLILVQVASQTPASVTDNISNIFVPLNTYTDGVVITQWFACIGGFTGPGEIFTVNAPAGYPAVQVFVFDGGPWMLTSQNGAASLAASLQPGIVSYNAGSIVVCGLSVGSLGSETLDSGFTLYQLSGVAGFANGVGAGYLLPGASGSVNPTWTLVPPGAGHMATGIAVFEIAAGPPPSVSCALGTATVGTPYSSSVVGSGGTPPYAYAIVSGVLPNGLMLNTSTGAITGTPTLAGTFNYTIQISDSLGNQGHNICSIRVSGPLTISCPKNTATLGAPYSGTFAPNGGTPPYTVSIISGTFPPGLTITPFDGSITGFPTATGAFTFTAQVQDSLGATAPTTCTITVASISLLCPGASGTKNVAYSSALTAVGGTAPYTYSITGGALPTGLALNTSTGAITGIPSAVGLFSFTAHVVDSLGAPASVNCSINIISIALTLTCASSIATLAIPYSSALVAAGGTSPYTYAINSGSLPPGLSLNTSTGAITGTPTLNGTYSYQGKVTDFLGATAFTNCSITVSGGAVISLLCALGYAILGLAYSAQTTVVNGTAPYAFSLTAGSLPIGLSLNTTTGVISGTPTVAGSSSYSIHVVDFLSHTATSMCMITVEGGRTFRYQIGNPTRPGRWFPHSYAAPVQLHYLVEPSDSAPNTQQLLLVSGTSLLLSGGNTDNGVPIACAVTTPSFDQGDERTQKLYVDTMFDAEGTGQLSAAVQFNNQTSPGPTVTVNPAGPRTQFLENISSLANLSLYRNIATTFTWTGGPDGPRLYAWEPSGFVQPYLSQFFVTQFLSLSYPGWKFARRFYPALISTAAVLFTVKCQDGRTYGPYSIPSTLGQLRILPMMFDQTLKDLAFAFQLDGGGAPFAFFPEDFFCEFKGWADPNFIKLAVFRT